MYKQICLDEQIDILRLEMLIAKLSVLLNYTSMVHGLINLWHKMLVRWYQLWQIKAKAK